MKVGRNDPCICGSGKKFKKCCQPASTMHRTSIAPDAITCNECGGEVRKKNYSYMDTTDMIGVDLVFAGQCDNCDCVTWAASGEPEAVASVMAFIESENGEGSWGVEGVKAEGIG